MSLLIKALKQAEKAHRAQSSQAVESITPEMSLSLDEAATAPKEMPSPPLRDTPDPQSLDRPSWSGPYGETPAPARHAPLELAREDEDRQPPAVTAPRPAPSSRAQVRSDWTADAQQDAPLPEPSAAPERGNGTPPRAPDVRRDSRLLARGVITAALFAATVAIGVWLYLQSLPESIPGYGPEASVTEEIVTPERGFAADDTIRVGATGGIDGVPAVTPSEGRREAGSSPAGTPLANDDIGPRATEKAAVLAPQAAAAGPVSSPPRPIATRDAAATSAPAASGNRVSSAVPVPRATAIANPPSQPLPSQAPVRFVRDGVTQTRKQAAIAAAWQALRDDSLELSEQLYREVLTLDPNQIDAWVGLASIASRRGDPASAQQHYERALRVDPNDPVARSGLLQLRGGASIDQESALRNAIASGRAGAAAHFALGQVLAAQGRWAEAQQAWFDAYAADPGNPDYAFNLAVALERIRQPMAALDHYRKALDAARARPSRFDTAQAQARIAVLEARATDGAPR